MAILKNFMGMLGINPGDEDIEDVEDVFPEQSDQDGNISRFGSRSAKDKNDSKILSMTGTVATSKMVITKPSCFEDVEEIGSYLKQRKSVIVNLETVNKEDGRRILDFLGGTAFALEGTVQKISTLISYNTKNCRNTK